MHFNYWPRAVTETKRRRMSIDADFEWQNIIGRGAYGEVRLYLVQPEGRLINA